MSDDAPNMDVDPVVDSYDPTGSADVNGGDTIVITGSSLLGVTSAAIGPYTAAFTVVSDNEIHVTAPAYDSSITSDPATAKLAVYKDSRGSDTSNAAEWTWGGWTRQQLQDAAAGN
jgi:hypothetical protein